MLGFDAAFRLRDNVFLSASASRNFAQATGRRQMPKKKCESQSKLGGKDGQSGSKDGRRKVTKVVHEGCEYFASTFEHDTVEDMPEQHDKEAVEDDVADFLPTRPATFSAEPVCTCTDARKHLTTNLSEDQGPK